MTAIEARTIARAGLLERYRRDGRREWLDATGRSMEPLIPAGSRLLVEFGAVPEHIGDIILFRRASGAVAHRVVARRRAGDRQMLVAKGDGEPLADPAIATDDVLGVVREVRLPDGRSDGLALARRRGAALARISWLSGRAARLGGRAARRLPAGSRPAAIAAVHALAALPTSLFLALIPRLDRGASAERR